MGWRFWERRQRKLPRRVKAYLAKEFGISSEQTMHLRCFQQKGMFAGRKVISLKIFDVSAPDQIRFEGYRENSHVHLHKRNRI